jgi:GNAT superfamily N-acetyltransferase
VNTAKRVQASIRAVNAAERDAVVAGSFTLYRNRASDHPYLNYAVPNAGPLAWDGIDALRAAFAAHGLAPRLEFVAECAPGLEEALAAAGFELQGRYPLMTLPAEDLREVPAPEGVVIARVLPGGDVRTLLRTAAEAFGDDGPTDAQVEEYMSHPPRGHLARAGGEPAGAAFHSPIAEGVSELGGIGVRERFRRRGIAAALTAASATAAVACGAGLCFLTPGDDGAERVYARAGFARAGTTVVHMVG